MRLRLTLVVATVVALATGALMAPAQGQAARGGTHRVLGTGVLWQSWMSQHEFDRDDRVSVRLRAGAMVWRLRARVPFRFAADTQPPAAAAECPPDYVGECNDTPEPPVLTGGVSVAVWTAHREGVWRLRLRVLNGTPDPLPVRLRWRDVLPKGAPPTLPWQSDPPTVEPPPLVEVWPPPSD
jgi:hypothetical protein